LKLEYPDWLSTFAFSFDLRRYSEGEEMVEAADFLRQAAEAGHTAGWSN